MKRLLLLSLVVCAGNAIAGQLPTLPAQEKTSPHKLYVSSQTDYGNAFNTWKFDGGYAYSVFDSVDVYIGARFDNSEDEENNEKGFLSGVSYKFSEKLSLQSALHSKNEVQESGEKEKVYSAEISSRMKLSEHIDLHATLDYAEWQQGFEVGLGFRF